MTLSESSCAGNHGDCAFCGLVVDNNNPRFRTSFGGSCRWIQSKRCRQHNQPRSNSAAFGPATKLRCTDQCFAYVFDRKQPWNLFLLLCLLCLLLQLLVIVYNDLRHSVPPRRRLKEPAAVAPPLCHPHHSLATLLRQPHQRGHVR